MNIFILEDSEDRIHTFIRIYSNHAITICNNAMIAMPILRDVKFDLIFLDHDLDHRVFVLSNEDNTGYQVAKSIKCGVNSITPIVIHSCNKFGSEKMLELLKEEHHGRYHACPFAWGNFFEDALSLVGKPT